jgi:hypothetical protein
VGTWYKVKKIGHLITQRARVKVQGPVGRGKTEAARCYAGLVAGERGRPLPARNMNTLARSYGLLRMSFKSCSFRRLQGPVWRLLLDIRSRNL